MSATSSASPEVPSLEGEYAGFVSRMMAFIIDILIIDAAVLVVTGVITLILGFFRSLYTLLPGGPDASLESVGAWVTTVTAAGTLLVMLWLYPTLFWMINGQTIGKRIMGLRVVRMDGEAMTFWRGILRVFGYMLSALPLFAGFGWVLFSNRRRGWHDVLTGTCVIYSWEARGSERLRLRLRSAGQGIKARRESS